MRSGQKWTISGGLGFLQMVLESDIERANKDADLKGVDCEIPNVFL